MTARGRRVTSSLAARPARGSTNHDLGLGLVDASVVAVAERLGLTEIATPTYRDSPSCARPMRHCSRSFPAEPVEHERRRRRSHDRFGFRCIGGFKPIFISRETVRLQVFQCASVVTRIDGFRGSSPRVRFTTCETPGKTILRVLSRGEERTTARRCRRGARAPRKRRRELTPGSGSLVPDPHWVPMARP